MRICHIIEAAGGGSGRVVLDLAKAGVAAGHDITVIYAPTRAEVAFVEGLSAISNVKIVISPMRREIGFHDVVDGWKLLQRLRQFGPFDVIHSHSSKAGGLARIVGLFLPKAVQIYTPHAFMTMAPDANPVYGRVENLLSHLGDGVIAVSAAERAHAQKLGIQNSKLHLVPNGIDAFSVDHASARRLMAVAENDFVIGFVGRLVKQKNPQRAILAFAEIAVAYPEAQLVVLGTGPLRAELDQLIQKHLLQERIKFFAGREARDFMAGFDCLLCSSDYEGFAISFLEALAAGVPIITTPVGGADETVIESVTGFQATDFSPSQLAAAAMKYIALSLEKRGEMSTQAQQHAYQFTIQKMAERTEASYRDAIASRRRA